MSLILWRALLTPLTSLRALAIRRRSQAPLSYDVAWRQARLGRCPDDMVYRLHGHQAAWHPDEAPALGGPARPSKTDEATG